MEDMNDYGPGGPFEALLTYFLVACFIIGWVYAGGLLLSSCIG